MRDRLRDSEVSMTGTPPYAAYASFDALLQRAAKEPVPPRLDRNLLQDWGIAAKNESAMLTSLRTLGLVDDEGIPAEDFRELRLSQPRHVAALRRALERAYPGLASAGHYPLDANRLRDYFVAERSLSGQMVDKATRFYRHLVEAASISVPVAEPPKPSITTPPIGKTERPFNGGSNLPGPRPSRSRKRRARRSNDEGVQLTLHVHVPFEASEEDLRQFFRRVKQAWGEERGAR